MVPSIKELRKISGQGRDSHFALWNKYVCSHFSIYITKALLYTNIKANQVTFAMIVLGFTGSVFLFFSHFAVGLLLIHLAILLDNVDGELARCRKQRSLRGMYLDSVYHRITTPMMLFGFAFGVFSLSGNKLLLVFGFAAALFTHSIVLPAIFDTIISLRLREASPPPLRVKSGGREVRMYEGHEKVGFSMVGIYHMAKDLWSYPSNVLMLTVLIIFETANLRFALTAPYTATLIFYAAYATVAFCTQALSFYFHTKRNSVDSFYVFLFGKK